MLKYTLYCFILFNLIFLNKTLSQALLTDTAFYELAKTHIIQLYRDTVKENLRLFSGYGVTATDRTVSGHPFFEYPDAQKGDIFYDGIHYPNVLLSYDIIRDEVNVIDPLKNLNIQLIAQKVNWFTIQDYLFVNIHQDSNSNNFPGSGYYELLYEGRGSVFSKRIKQLDQSLKADEASKFIEWTWYYVKKEAVYYPVTNKRSLLAVCKEHETDVAKFMQKENLNFKKDPANTIIKVIKYYTQLKNN